MLDQLLVGAAPGDAITTSAFRLRNALREFGPSEIYSRFPEPSLVGDVHPLDALAGRPNRERPLVFHASIGCWDVHQALVEHEPRLVLVYHNISPPEYFERYEPLVADDLLRGRWELDRLRERVELSIADSEFNAGELRELGYTDVHVIPPTPEIGRITATEPDARMLRRIRKWGPGPVILTVSQLMPHKRVERAVAAAAVYQQEFDVGARLAVVGVDRFPDYSMSIRVFADSVGLIGDPFLGRVTDAELAALYRKADVFLTLSEHEGFCVPVVEAMAAGVPVVASPRAALPETVGGAGIIVPDPDDPVFVAGLLDEVLTNQSLADLLRARGDARAVELGAEASLVKYLDLLGRHLEVLT
jgi:glycosyltransferase involved in cell wall biosynthesis